MANTHFSGPVISAAGVVGGIQASTLDGIVGQAAAAVKLPMTVTATANSDFTIAVPVGATISAIRVYTTTAFTAVTDAQISVGKTVGGAEYSALATIKAAGVYSLSFVASAVSAADMLSVPQTLNVRIVQTGGATAVGAATMVVSYHIA